MLKVPEYLEYLIPQVNVCVCTSKYRVPAVILLFWTLAVGTLTALHLGCQGKYLVWHGSNGDEGKKQNSVTLRSFSE